MLAKELKKGNLNSKWTKGSSFMQITNYSMFPSLKSAVETRECKSAMWRFRLACIFLEHCPEICILSTTTIYKLTDWCRNHSALPKVLSLISNPTEFCASSASANLLGAGVVGWPDDRLHEPLSHQRQVLIGDLVVHLSMVTFLEIIQNQNISP